MNTLSGLQRSNFQKEIDGKKTDLFVLKNKNGVEVCVTNMGGKIVSVWVPDAAGKFSDVVSGHQSVDEYISSPEAYFGAAIGRYGNRIANGVFYIDGQKYQLNVNNGPNSLHGGPTGFHARVWDAKQVNDQTLELYYTSADGEEGFPGELKVKMTYKLTDDNAIDISYEATTSKPTVVNLTNHSYFNLAGADHSTINDHVVEVNADYFVPANENMIPTGEICKVAGTPMDFTTPHTIGERINADFEQLKIGNGYDHTWVLNKQETGSLSLAAKVTEPASGRVMEVYTSEPGMQIYTGNFMADNAMGKHGKTYPCRSAVCFETQHFPDSPNQPHFPPVVLRPGGKYESRTIYKFSTKNK